MRRHHPEKVPLEDRRPRNSKIPSRSAGGDFDVNSLLLENAVESPPGGSLAVHHALVGLQESCETFSRDMEHET